MTTYTTAQVNAWYQSVQFRDGPTTTVSQFVTQLNSGVTTAALVQTSIIQDTFTAAYVNPVIRLYQAAFNRVPDQSGQNYWVDSIAAGTQTTQTLANSFANSTEFQSTYGASASSAASTAVVTALYYNVLNRAPDTAGLTYWTSNGFTVGYVLNQFAQSPELVLATQAAIPLFQKAEIAGTYATSGALWQYGGFPGNTYTLTTGVDTVNIQGSWGTVNGTGTTFTAGDTITAAAGSQGNKLVINDTTGASVNGVPAGVTVTNVQVDNVTSSGSIGRAASGVTASQIQTLTYTASTAGATSTILAGGVSVIATVGGAGDATGADSATAANTALTAIYSALGYTVVSGAAPANASEVRIQTLAATPAPGQTQVKITTFAGVSVPVSTVTTASSPDALPAIATTGATVATTAIVYDVAGFTGLTEFNGSSLGGANLNVSATTAVTEIESGAGAIAVAGGNSVTINGGSTVALTDTNIGAGAANAALKTVSLTGFSGAATIASSVLNNLSVANTNQNVTVTAAAGTRALTLNTNNVTGGTILDAEATSLALTNSSAASTGLTVSTAKATTISVAGDAGINFSLAGTGASQAANLAITSTNTAGVTIGTQLDNDVTFTGGAGSDSITIGATTKAITMGAGTNTVSIAAGVSTIGTGGSVNGGTGTSDLLAMATDDAAAATASSSAYSAFGAKVTGFEQLALYAAGSASKTVDMSYLGNIQTVFTVGAAVGDTLTLSKVATGFTLNQNVDSAGTTAVTLATDGVSDVLNYKVSSGAAVTAAAVTATGFETINITSDDFAATPAGGYLNKITALTDANATTIVISGDAGFQLGFTGTAATTVDASGITVGGFTWTAGALAASSVVKGSATGTNTINLNSATTASTFVTYTGGTGNDVIASTNNNNNIFSLGDGANSINTGGAAGGGNNTVTGGAGVDVVKFGNGANIISTLGGNDEVIVGTGANTVNLGDGNDLITVGTGLNIVTFGAGTDKITLSGGSINANTFSTVVDFAVGDQIKFTDNGTPTPSPLGAAVTLAPGATLSDYANAAASGNGSVNAIVKWFQFGTDTYLVNDLSAGGTFANGTDQIIKVTGLKDLSTSTVDADNLVTYV